MSRRLHIGFFEDDRDLLDAVRECRRREIPVVDVVSPFPIHGVDQALGIRPSRLGWVTFAGGAAGCALGLWLQYWTSAVDWPLNVGGKPFDSLPAFIPVVFELTILLAGLATALLLLVRCGLWPGRKAPAGLEATTDGRMALILAQSDASFRSEDYADLWSRHGASESRVQTEELP